MGDVASGRRKAAAIEVRVFGQTDVGQVREHNEDNFLVADLTKKTREFDPAEVHTLGRSGAVFGVCDGMGGAAAGFLVTAPLREGGSGEKRRGNRDKGQPSEHATSKKNGDTQLTPFSR